MLKRYITFKITLLSRTCSLILFEAVSYPRTKKFEVYFSTGNKGVNVGDILPGFCINYKRFLAN
jgi:hypothetical protein